jgi:hypothetical protein
MRKLPSEVSVGGQRALFLIFAQWLCRNSFLNLRNLNEFVWNNIGVEILRFSHGLYVKCLAELP